jgi:hypothetical protein
MLMALGKMIRNPRGANQEVDRLAFHDCNRQSVGSRPRSLILVAFSAARPGSIDAVNRKQFHDYGGLHPWSCNWLTTRSTLPARTLGLVVLELLVSAVRDTPTLKASAAFLFKSHGGFAHPWASTRLMH